MCTKQRNYAKQAAGKQFAGKEDPASSEESRRKLL
jgi:hypothetical protein